MTELISPREAAYMAVAVLVLLVLIALVVMQSFRSRQISRMTMNVILGTLVTAVLVVALLFMEYALPTRSEPDYVPRKRRTVVRASLAQRSGIMRPTLPRTYVCYRAAVPPAIDGSLTDPAWLDVPWTDLFVDIRGETNAPPRYRTRAKLMWDDICLYIGADIEEPHVWATLTERNAVIFHDNDFEVFIDPDGDNHTYYEFEINALNTIWELTLPRPYRDGGPPLHGTNMKGLRSAVLVAGTLNNPADKDRGWSVELALPWEGFRRYTEGSLPPRDGDQWRMNFSRVEWQHTVEDGAYRKVPETPEDNWVWSPQGVVDMHRPETWGYVQFAAGERDAVAFRPDPSAPVRQVLMDLYYRQRAFFERHKRWATTLGELGVEPDSRQGEARIAAMRGGPAGFTATGVIVLVDGRLLTLNVNQESRIWKD